MEHQQSEVLRARRALLVSLDFLGSPVYRVTMETRVQKVPEVLLVSQAWMAFLARREQRVTEASKGKWVYPEEKVVHLDLQDPLDLQDRSSTSLGGMGELELWGEQEPRGHQERRATREMWVLLDMPLRAKRVSPGSSLDQMGDLCTWAVWQENRGIQVLQGHWGLQAQLDLMDRRERLVSPVGRVVLA